MRKSRAGVLVALALAVLSLVVAACGGSDDNNDKAKASGATTASPASL
jgi:ABC-type Fe3+-citrate transport system substrate-binding protein